MGLSTSPFITAPCGPAQEEIRASKEAMMIVNLISQISHLKEISKVQKPYPPQSTQGFTEFKQRKSLNDITQKSGVSLCVTL
jgi:hypothetical protein